MEDIKFFGLEEEELTEQQLIEASENNRRFFLQRLECCDVEEELGSVLWFVSDGLKKATGRTFDECAKHVAVTICKVMLDSISDKDRSKMLEKIDAIGFPDTFFGKTRKEALRIICESQIDDVDFLNAVISNVVETYSSIYKENSFANDIFANGRELFSMIIMDGVLHYCFFVLKKNKKVKYSDYFSQQ